MPAGNAGVREVDYNASACTLTQIYALVYFVFHCYHGAFMWDSAACYLYCYYYEYPVYRYEMKGKNPCN